MAPAQKLRESRTKEQNKASNEREQLVKDLNEDLAREYHAIMRMSSIRRY